MPLIKGAIKKLRQDKAAKARNRQAREVLREVLKQTKEKPTADNLSQAFSALDKAVKRGLIKKEKANRTKSRLNKQVPSKSEKATTKTKTKAKTKKASSKAG